MNISIRVRVNTIEPSVARGLAAARRPARVWQAGALALASMTQRAFSDAGLRAAAWPPKRDGSPSTLRGKGGRAGLWGSIRVTEYSDRGAKVGSDRRYAAIHQFGGTIYAKPGKFLVFPAPGGAARGKGGKGGKGAGMIFAKKVKIPARPYFPFYKSGLPTFRAKEAINAAMRRAIAAQVSGGTGGAAAT